MDLASLIAVFLTISIPSVLENFLPLWEIYYITNKLILIAFSKFYLLGHENDLTLQQSNYILTTLFSNLSK